MRNFWEFDRWYVTQNQETNLQVITELRKKQGLYEEEIETLKNDVENFKVQLDNERKYAFPISYVSAYLSAYRENNNHQLNLQERAEQDSVYTFGD